jgi:hypothetical protein
MEDKWVDNPCKAGDKMGIFHNFDHSLTIRTLSHISQVLVSFWSNACIATFKEYYKQKSVQGYLPISSMKVQ